jgi:gamma-glutamylcyclotransferase (GGCT)/AIG2-like uncharacterized protein YtfP
MSSQLFAYGTLMPRDASEAVAGGWSADAVTGRLYDMGPYPALVDLDDPTAGWVEGYLREVDPAELEALDRYEEVGVGPYRRVQTQTRDGVLAWVYVYFETLPQETRGPLACWKAPTHE